MTENCRVRIKRVCLGVQGAKPPAVRSEATHALYLSR